MLFCLLLCCLNPLALPPLPKRGSEIRIDWLAISFPSQSIDRIRFLFQQAFGESFAPKLSPNGDIIGSPWYKEIHLAPSGASLALHLRSGQPLSQLVLPASSLSRISAFHLLQFLRLLPSGSRCSRLDLALDDFSRRLSPTWIQDRFLANEIVGFRSPGISRGKLIREFFKAPIGDSPLVADSFYIGSRGRAGCGKFLRAYDKSIESNGAIPSYRLELEFSDRYSRQAFAEILAIPAFEQDSLEFRQIFSEILRGIFSGAIDFRFYRSASGKLLNRGKRDRLPLWEEILGCDWKCPFKGARRPPLSFQKLNSWIRSQILPSFALFLSLLSDRLEDDSDLADLVRGLWLSGCSRWNPRHYSLLEVMQS